MARVRIVRLLLVAGSISLLFLFGCMAQTNLMSTQPEQWNKENSMVYNAGINKVWDASIKTISEKFFVLDNISKESRIITLSFASDTPAEYVDCGQVTVTNSGGASGGSTYTFPGAQAYTEYKAASGGPHILPVMRRAKLNGKVNIVFSEEGENSTRIIVNTRYIVDVTKNAQEMTPYGPRNYTARASTIFNSGQDGTSEDGEMTCAAKFTLEKKILDDIKEKLTVKAY